MLKYNATKKEKYYEARELIRLRKQLTKQVFEE